MINAISTALKIDLSGFDVKKHRIVIYYDGRPVMIGKPSAKGYHEGFYRVSPDGRQYGACISAPFAKTAEQAIMTLAVAMVRANPKPGQVRTMAESFATKLVARIESRVKRS